MAAAHARRCVRAVHPHARMLHLGPRMHAPHELSGGRGRAAGVTLALGFQLVQQLNASIDVPLLSEDQEAALIDASLTSITNVLHAVVPAQWLAQLQGSSTPLELRQLEELVVRRVDALIPVGTTLAPPPN
jgi:hypothetical protein